MTTQPEPASRGGAAADSTGQDAALVGGQAVEPDGPALTVAAVARRLGVAPATLRTWDRRYGLGPSGHTTGRHRRYGPQDVARLELMQQALLRGASPAEAARYALATPVSSAPRASRRPAPLAADPVDREFERRDPLLARFADVDPAGDLPLIAVGEIGSGGSGEFRGGGGGLRLPGASRRARGLGRAVLAMDTAGVCALLADSIDTVGLVRTWDEVVRPVMCAVAERWAHSGAGVELEHLFTQCLVTVFSRVCGNAPVVRNPRPVLLACAPDEQHSLPLLALSTALATRGIGSQLLGAAVPLDALAAAVRRTAPAVVCLWAQLPRYADVAVLAGVPRTRPRVRLFAGGPGWQAVDLPPQVDLLDGLDRAAARIEASVFGGEPGE